MIGRGIDALRPGVLCALGVAVCSCAATEPALTEAPVAVPELPIDGALVDDVVRLSIELIQSRPVNPPGNEARIARLLAGHLDDEGIATELVAFDGPDRLNLMARVPGNGKDPHPIVLLGHSDVVPADASEWSETTPPFAATVQGNELVGRGAIDMLSMVALETQALIAMARLPDKLDRDVILLVTGDEEVDGRGIQHALAEWPVLAQARLVITEGAYFIQDYFEAGEDLAPVAVAEKGLFQFVLETRGPSGHGSTPTEDDAPRRLVRAASRVLDVALPLRLTPPTERMFARLGQRRGGIAGVVLGTPLLLTRLGRDQLEENPTTRALVHDTCALTQLAAGEKQNVIPARARAHFDCRLLPGTDPARFRDALLLAIDDPRVTLTVLQHNPANGSPADDVFLDVVTARVRRTLPGALTLPILTKGATDGRFLRALGVPVYGFVPVRLNTAELSALHGANERVRLTELRAGLSVLVDVTVAMASAGR